MAESGIQKDGTWRAEFEGQRPPFEPGNSVGEGNTNALRHGAYSRLVISERGEEIAHELRDDFQAAADELSVRALAECWAQVKLAGEALAAVEELMKTPGHKAAARLKFIRLSEDMRGWVRDLFKVLDRLGATPQARAEVAARLASMKRSPAQFDPDLLDIKERVELERLLTKGTKTSDE